MSVSGYEFDETKPKYRQIYQDIVSKIRSGALPPKSKLSEVQMVMTYGVTRDTVRKAMKLLREEGWIRTEHSMGSFVEPPPYPET